MKTTKKDCAWFAVLTALLCAMIFMGCGGGTDNENTPITTGGLSAKTKKRIRQDLIDYREQGFSVSDDDYPELLYKGTYNGYVVVDVDYKPVTPAIRNEIIAGIGFPAIGGGSLTIYAWKPGKIYTLQEAYDLELLTRENLFSIRYYPVISADKEGENLFSPQSRRLNAETERFILKYLGEYLNKELGISISVVHCYDICNGYIVLEHEYRDDILSGNLRYITIDGLEFTVTQRGGIYTWGHGFHTLEETYDTFILETLPDLYALGKGLSREDLENIHSYNRLRYEGGEK